ncbi:dihydropyrimidine dehydrogenase [Halorubrum californiense DSM 19288]|uniref:Dihydropyrimidine dehydrogenase n=1 Tax=Halorubrum californiense DSM 19288 TaxID=1227465 RepID=M0EI27_9EURY|nr:MULTISPECIES: dihydropyrimidine dehydrogenase [Halorubrum]ELZ46733.1 dihydropyrimidine dehydrogenase [Halorubrum californiense DSM 19288]TKX65612.1 dihydropyrimidine dehydrogenase [Halorubrum sp. GN11GM_10-3_MGM]
MTREPFLVAASLSGAADVEWARAAAEHVDVALLGGVALDPASRAAARDLVARGRSEFLPADPVAFVADQLDALADAPVRPGINVRSATPEPIRAVAEICADRGAVCEVNAHCRQPELRAVGCGESLLREPDRLARYVAAAAETGATTSVKVRAEVSGVDLVEVAETTAAAGADWLHVDAMDSGAVIADLAAAVGGKAGGDEETASGDGDESALADLTLVANNGVRGPDTVAEYAAHGADAVSVGRPTEDPPVLARVADAVEEWRGGRLRRDGSEAGPGPEARP